MSSLAERTKRDFGEQWHHYGDNHGFHASRDLAEGVYGPVFPLENFAGKDVLEIGSGSGRYANIILECNAASLIAVEPSSEGMAVLKQSTAAHAARVQYVQSAGDQLPDDTQVDIVFSNGVIHHIPEPDPVMAAAFRALRPGGEVVIWLYGYENNEVYLAFVNPLRALTTRMPHALLAGLSWMLTLACDFYIALCRVLPLPLKRYMLDSFAQFTRNRRQLVIYDQLNPAWAKYYRRQEAHDLLARAGFEDIRLHHHQGYSWTVVGRKPR